MKKDVALVFLLLYALVIARFRVQYGQYFLSFSYFADLKQNMRNQENIGHIVRDKRAITRLSLTFSLNSTFIKG